MLSFVSRFFCVITVCIKYDWGINSGGKIMSADNINIGLIGAGGNTKLRHIPGFNSQGNVFIQSVCNSCLLYTSPSPRD